MKRVPAASRFWIDVRSHSYVPNNSCFGRLYGAPRRKIVTVCYRESVRQDFCYVHFLLCKNTGCAELHYGAETRHEVSQELKISRSPREGTPIIAFSVKLSGYALQLDTLFLLINVEYI